MQPNKDVSNYPLEAINTCIISVKPNILDSHSARSHLLIFAIKSSSSPKFSRQGSAIISHNTPFHYTASNGGTSLDNAP